MAVYQSLSVTQVSQNQEENSSQVRILWESTQTGGSYNDTRRTASYTVSCNGQPSQSYTVSYTLPMQSTAVILDTTLTVPHDSKGEGVVEVTTWMNTNISAGVVELSQKLILDTIAQASTVLAADGVIGGVSRLAIIKKNAAHTHSIGYSFGQLSGYLSSQGTVQPEEVRFSGDSVDFAIPESFYSQIPNAKSGICQLTIWTFSGDTPVGQPQTAEFTASAEESACLPTVAGQVADINEVTRALTGDERVIVPYGSRILCTVTAEAKHGAVIVKKTLSGTELSGDSVELTQLPGDRLVVTAQDSRGFVAQQVLEIPQIPYEKPAFEAQISRTDRVSGAAELTLSGTCFSGSFGDEGNSLQAAYSLDGVSYTTIDSLSLGENSFTARQSLENMAYDRVYAVTVRVWDKLFTVEKQLVLKKVQPVFDWGEEDFAFHVPVSMDSPLSLQNGGTGVSHWENGVAVKTDAGLTAVPTAQGAFYQADTLQFGVLPVALGGTGSTDAQTACENLGISYPLELGQEYDTRRKWQGQPVYTRLVEYGSLPNSKLQAVPHGAAVRQMLFCCGTASNGRTLPWGGIHVYRADLYCDRENIYIDAEMDYSNVTATVQIWYTK